jgi:hypothetical protein
MNLKHYLQAAAILAAAALSVTCNEDSNTSVPAQAVITGAAENECPAKFVLLTAAADGAQSYLWYRDAFLIDGATASTYAAESDGTYYAVGVNANGKGRKSAGKEVAVNTGCAPTTPELTGRATNLCPALTVRLEASAVAAETYIWYKDGAVIPGATAEFYEAAEDGVYAVVAGNTHGISAKSEEKTVAIVACPPAAPMVYGSSYFNDCPETSVVLTAYSAGADSYQWYRSDKSTLVPISGATASTYEVTVKGAYYATATNHIGTSEPSANACTVLIDICSGSGFSYSDLLGNYTATGTPCMWLEPGPASWTTTISDHETDVEYEIKPFAGACTDTKDDLLPVYLEMAQSTDGSTIGFGISNVRPLGSEMEDGKVYTAYFDAFITRTEGTTRYITWFAFDNNHYQVFWDPAGRTLDLSGVYSDDSGVDYEIIVAIVARTADPSDPETKKWEGSFSDGYRHCKLVKNGASGAPAAFTGERVPLPRFNAPASGETWKSVTIPFDPAKFSRKR